MVYHAISTAVQHSASLIASIFTNVRIRGFYYINNLS